MRPIKDRIEEIRTNGYELDFGNIFEHACENYKKIALYAGLMLLVFIVLFSILLSTVFISYLGIEYLEDFSNKLKQFSMLKVVPLDIVLPINTGLIVFSGLINPFMAGFFKMADCGEKGEEFHVSTMFTYYKSPYFLTIFISVFLIAVLTSGLSILFEFAGFSFLGSMLSLMISFITFLTIPLIIFGNLNALNAIKSSIIIVLKQPLVLLGLLIVAVMASLVGLIGCFVGVFFTIPFIYSMNYTIYSKIIGIDSNSELIEKDK